MGKGRRSIDINDLVGKRAGSIVVESYSHKEVVEAGETSYTYHFYNCKCDVCNEKIFSKCLSAEVMKNGRVKSQQDMAIIRKRKSRIGLRSGGEYK